MKQFFSKHGIWILATTALLSVLLALASLFGSTNLLKNLAGVIAYPFRATYTAVSHRYDNLQKHFADYSALEQQLAEREREVAELEEALRQSEADRQENVRLRELAGLRAQRRDFVFEAAEIISRDSSNWTDALTLNRGTSHGIAIGDCVVTSGGALVGEVTDAGVNWCTVLTICDTDTDLGARVFRTGDLAIAAGDFALMSQDQLKLSFLPANASLLQGDQIVTSGLGGYYPSGLIIGTVASIHIDDSGLTDYAILTPVADLHHLSQVFIIKEFTIVE